MSETRYERTEKDGKVEWFKVWGTTGKKVPAAFPEIAEEAYQLGLQSPPAPTDLLLTDEEIKDVYRSLPARSYLSGLSELLKGKTDNMVIERAIAKAQLSKLQQARPTEQAREKVAQLSYEVLLGEIFHMKRVGFIEWSKLPDKIKKEHYSFADQILRLRLLPDEQAIRKEERKEIGKWLEKSLFRDLLDFVYKDDWDKVVASLKAGQMPEAGEQPGGKK